MEIAEVRFMVYEDSIREALEIIGAPKVLATQSRVMVKPNLVNASAAPITTPPACTGAIVKLVREWSDAEVIIAEGCGASDMDTMLNTAETIRLENPECAVFPEFHMPKVALEYYIISVPVLKAHSFAEITGSLKNMMGFAPPSHYQQGGYWKKSAFHARMHEAITDLNRYRTPDLTVMDASVGMPEFHLGGPVCNPPVNKILAGFDPKVVDRRSAELLGFDWRHIDHLA